MGWESKANINFIVALVATIVVPTLATVFIHDSAAAYTITTIAFHVGVGCAMMGVAWVWWGIHKEDLKAAIKS